MTLILGIDPGSRFTGYGIINVTGNRSEYITCGCIRVATAALPLRLKQIYAELCQVIEEFSPQEAAIEEVFMGKNASSALKLGQARGSAIVACVNHELEVSEYSTRKVKQAVVGNGAADKLQVQHMVKALLRLSGKIQEDAADALAVAICHSNTRNSLIRMAGASSFRRRRLQAPLKHFSVK